MCIRVRSISSEARAIKALVTASSRERYAGHPVALIRINLRLPVLAGESDRATRERVRDEALRFLDIL